MLRALVYGGLSQGPEQIPILVLGFEGVGTLAEASPLFGVVLGLLSIVGPVALFSTMRARNGFATLHGLASRTRVVAVASDTARTTFARWRASGWRLRVARDDRRYVGARL